jgi:hypothetical protein
MSYIYKLKKPRKLSEADKEPVTDLEFNTDDMLASDMERTPTMNVHTLNITLAAGRCLRTPDEIRSLHASDYLGIVREVLDPLMEGIPFVEKKSSAE